MEAPIQVQKKKAKTQKKVLEEANKKDIEDLKPQRKTLIKRLDNH